MNTHIILWTEKIIHPTVGDVGEYARITKDKRFLIISFKNIRCEKNNRTSS